MKRFFYLIVLLSMSTAISFGADFSDYDFNQIDNPFAGQKQYTQQDFNKAIQQYKKPAQKKQGGFWNWFFRHTTHQDEGPSVNYKEQYENIPSEMNYPKEVMSLKPSLALGAEIYDAEGKIISPGYYQITKEDDFIILSQGNSTSGKLRAKTYDDKEYKKNDIIYARVESVNDEIIKIIYSNLNDCFVGYARVRN